MIAKSTETARFETRFTFSLGMGRKSDCNVEVNKVGSGRLRVTLYESSARSGGLVYREYAQVASQVYARFLRGIPRERISWLYRSELELLNATLTWDGERFFAPSFMDSSSRSDAV